MSKKKLEPIILAPVKIAKTGNRYIITLPRRARYATRLYRGKALRITIEEMSEELSD